MAVNFDEISAEISVEIARITELSSNELDRFQDENPALVCPVSYVFMNDPVIVIEGQTYERKAIEAWLKISGTNPATNTVLPQPYMLIPNLALKEAGQKALKDFKEKLRLEAEAKAQAENPNAPLPTVAAVTIPPIEAVVPAVETEVSVAETIEPSPSLYSLYHDLHPDWEVVLNSGLGQRYLGDFQESYNVANSQSSSSVSSSSSSSFSQTPVARVFESVSEEIEALVGEIDEDVIYNANKDFADRGYICSISQDIMRNPVKAADGHTYERTAIATWLETHKTSPLTGASLINKNLTPNTELQTRIKADLENLINGKPFSPVVATSFVPPNPPAAAPISISRSLLPSNSGYYSSYYQQSSSYSASSNSFVLPNPPAAAPISISLSSSSSSAVPPAQSRSSNVSSSVNPSNRTVAPGARSNLYSRKLVFSPSLSSSSVRTPAQSQSVSISEPENEVIVQCRMAGEWGVGKSKLLLRMSEGTFSQRDERHSANPRVKIVDLAQGNRVRLMIYDTERSQVSMGLTPELNSGIKVFLFCFNVADSSSFPSISKQPKYLRKWAKPDVKIILVATQCDEGRKRMMTSEQGQAMASKFKYDGYIETSAKTGLNCQELAKAVAELAIAPAPVIERISNWLGSFSLFSSSSSSSSFSSSSGSNPSSNSNAVQSRSMPNPINIVLEGYSGTGKSCLLCRISDDTFIENYPSTRGVDLKVKAIALRGEQVKVHFFDAERGADFGDLRLKSAHVVIACYDVSDRLSFYNLDRVKSAIEQNSNQNVKVFLVANKIDLANRVISSEEGRARATELGFDGYFETSAKTGRGCEEVVLAAAELLVAPAPSSGARGPR